MAQAKVDWYGKDVMLAVDEMSQEALLEIALRVEERAKGNIVANDQVDTGFMLNSGYTVSAMGQSTYGEARQAENRNPKARLMPEVRLGEALAAVAFGAEYAVYQEMLKSFLYRAAEQVANEAGGIIEEVGRRND